MTDSIRVLAVAAALSAAAVTLLAWRVTRLDPSSPDRLIGELRLSRWAAVLLAGAASIWIGLAIARPDAAFAGTDAAFGAVFTGVAGLVLQRDPREGLPIAAGAFVAHALVSVAHRPGWLSPEVAPHWYITGTAIYDVYIGALCFWTRHR